MKKSKFIIYLALLIIAFLLLGISIAYTIYDNKKEKEENLKEGSDLEKEIIQSEEQEKVIEEEAEVVKEPIDESEDIVSENSFVQYKGILEDVRGKNSKGEAVVSYSNGNFGLKATFEDLEDPEEKHFYEGWIVRKKPYRVLSTGKVEKKDGKYINVFSSTEDLTDHVLYVLTIEPDDDDKRPAEHILEGELQKEK